MLNCQNWSKPRSKHLKTMSETIENQVIKRQTGKLKLMKNVNISEDDVKTTKNYVKTSKNRSNCQKMPTFNKICKNRQQHPNSRPGRDTGISKLFLNISNRA